MENFEFFDLHSISYFFPNLDSESASDLLGQCEIGTFLIRPSSLRNTLTLSIRGKAHVHHTRIHASPIDRMYYVQANHADDEDGGNEYFQSVQELVDYYKKCQVCLIADNDPNRVPLEGSPFKMKHPLDRKSLMVAHSDIQLPTSSPSSSPQIEHWIRSNRENDNNGILLGSVGSTHSTLSSSIDSNPLTPPPQRAAHRLNCVD